MVITVKSSHGPVQSTKNNKGKQKQKQKQEDQIDPEIPLGKYLASTEKPIRDKAVKSLAAFLATGAAQTQEDGIGLPDEKEMDKLWKGIFYCFWMSDKPLVQQALATELSELILSIPRADQPGPSSTSTSASSSSSQPLAASASSRKSSKRRKSENQEKIASTAQFTETASNRAKIGLAFMSGFWKAMIREWSGLDKYRFLASEDWNPSAVQLFGQNLHQGGLNPFNHQLPSSIIYHISDIYLDELEKALKSSREAKISSSTSPSSVASFPLLDLLSPFITLITSTSAKITYERVWKNIFEKFWQDTKAVEQALKDFEAGNQSAASEKKRSASGPAEKQQKRRKGAEGLLDDSMIDSEEYEQEGSEEKMQVISNATEYPEIFIFSTRSEELGELTALRKLKTGLLKKLFEMASRKESNEARRRNVYEFWKENGGGDDDDDEN